PERLETAGLPTRAGGTLPRRPLAEHSLRPRQARPGAVIHPSHEMPQRRDSTMLGDHPLGQPPEPPLGHIPRTVAPRSGGGGDADAIVASRPVLGFEHVGPAEDDAAA